MTSNILCLLTLVSVLSCSPKKNSGPSNISEGIWINPVDKMVFTWIPPGKLNVYANEIIGEQTNTIQKEVVIPQGFWMGKTEVSVKQFSAFVENTRYITEAESDKHRFNWRSPGFDQEPDHPVVYVSTRDMRQYMEWADVEVPSQEEWIYATRANTQTPYFWGKEFNDDYLWYRMNASGGTRPVGTKLPNNWGLHDMIGNVYEYVLVCDDAYATMGSSWTRCNKYSSHNQGDTVELNIGRIKDIKLLDCSAGLINPWNDDTGFRCIKHIN